ncbi:MULTISPECIES: hypothetical protein [unclassified Burkholderia]|nr:MULTISPECIES: hypothetical protein [unclassified Burkholderia]
MSAPNGNPVRQTKQRILLVASINSIDRGNPREYYLTHHLENR